MQPITMPAWALVASAAGLLVVGSAIGFALGETFGGGPPSDHNQRMRDKERKLAEKQEAFARCRSDLALATKGEKRMAHRVRELSNENRRLQGQAR